MDYEISSISDVVEKYLKDRILGARLTSGMKIVEKDVADALEVSRAPVREALGKLSQQGLVVFSPRRGHFVLEMPREGILELFQIRITLELQILRILVAENMLGPEDYNKLLLFSQEMEEAEKLAKSESNRLYYLNSLDIKFHRYLWQVSKSARRAQLLEGLFFQLLIVMNEDVSAFGVNQEKAEEHRALVEALQTNDVQTVCIAFRCHLDKYIDATLGPLSLAEQHSLDIVFGEIN